MTKDECLLVVLSEECAEVQQAVSKALRFGLNNCHPDTPGCTNEYNILYEFYQLEEVMYMLFDSGVLHEFRPLNKFNIQKDKMDKVEQYLSLFRDLGIIK